MIYMQRKLELYKELTGYTPAQIAADMQQIEVKEVNRVLKGKLDMSPEFLMKYYKMVRRELTITPTVVLHPELFLPFLPFVYAVLSHEGKWYSVENGNIDKMPQYTPELPEVSGFFIPPLPAYHEEIVVFQRLPIGWVWIKDYQTRHQYLTF